MRTRQQFFSDGKKSRNNREHGLAALAIGLIILLSSVGCGSGPGAENTSDPTVRIVLDGPIGPSALFALEELQNTLKQAGTPFEAAEDFDPASSQRFLLIGTLPEAGRIGGWVESGDLDLAADKESLAVGRLRIEGRTVLVAAGADNRGLMYALLDMAEQVKALAQPKKWWDRIETVSESPLVPVRSMAVLLHNEDCEKEWYYSKDHWRKYFAMLAGNRWNAFNLIFSHQTAYLSPLYAFHVRVEQHPEVRARGLSEEKRIRNLEMLKYISSLAGEYGIDFTLGIWQQIAWEGKHQGSRQESMVTGLTRKNMYSYTYHALLKLLRQCPDIKALQLRINHESGIDYDEQTEFYTNSVFKAIKDCGRPILLENRNVGLLRETIQASLDMDIPTRVSHKYWGEHMVLPYHPTRIMWTYSYGDWLKYPQKFRNMYQVWSLGSHRLFVWGDPEYARRFAPTTVFQNAEGFELCAPLSQKGFGNAPGAWRIFRDQEREHYKWEFERYWSTYLLFGRMSYNPGTGDEVWLRELRSRFGDNAFGDMAEAYRAASRILPLIQGAATPDYNMYTWIEKDSGGLINFYLHEFSYDQIRIASFMDFIQRTPEQRFSAKLTPEKLADRLEAVAAECRAALERAEGMQKAENKELWATAKDFRILSGMARFFAQKIRATTKLGFFYQLGDRSLLKEAIDHGRQGLEIWKQISAEAEEIYTPDLVTGPGSRGHWKDQLFFVENDLKQLLHQDELFDMVENFDIGFDFGPRAYTPPTEIYTPWYTNGYHIEHRFQGVFPHSFFNPQQGFGWNNAAVLTSEQPAKVGREVWRASNLDDLNIPFKVLLSDHVRGTEDAIFRIDLPEGHYQATLIFTDQTREPRDHGPMSVSVVERFGERPIMTDRSIPKGETVVERFNFNMTGSRYSNFRLKFSAAPGADFIVSGLTFTRIEPHIAHRPVYRARPGEALPFKATVTLPPQVLQPVKNSLSIARGTTSTIEPPDRITQARLLYSTDDGRSYSSMDMQEEEAGIYSATLAAGSVREGTIRYYFEASDSIGQTVHMPGKKTAPAWYTIRVSSDRTPPVVSHQPVEAADPGAAIPLRVEAADASGMRKVVLYYRQTRQALQYSRIQMTAEKGGVYTAVIPGEMVTAEFDMMYFFEAVDEIGNGVFFPNQDNADPHLIVKVRR